MRQTNHYLFCYCIYKMKYWRSRIVCAQSFGLIVSLFRLFCGESYRSILLFCGFYSLLKHTRNTTKSVAEQNTKNSAWKIFPPIQRTQAITSRNYRKVSSVSIKIYKERNTQTIYPVTDFFFFLQSKLVRREHSRHKYGW
jgi:hypothetical protein